MAVALLVALIEVTRPTPRPGLAFKTPIQPDTATAQAPDSGTRGPGTGGRTADTAKSAADVIPPPDTSRARGVIRRGACRPLEEGRAGSADHVDRNDLRVERREGDDASGGSTSKDSD